MLPTSTERPHLRVPLRRAAAVVASGLALWLAGCASAPPQRPVGVASPPPPVLAPAPAPAPPRPPEAAVTSPIRGPGASAPAPLASAGAGSAPAATDVTGAEPYGAAVAARFPDPPVRFDTPAFAPGRSTYTSNAELQSLLRGLVREPGANATRVRLIALGSSQAGAPLEALLFTRQSDPAPAALLASGRPTVLLVGQQHGNEPAGSEALLVLARQLASGPLEALLDRINVLVLARANPDGAEAGRRDSASGIDLNRDHLLLRTPEAQAQATLVREYRPVVVVDAHEFTVVGRFREKFGAVQRFDALLQYATTPNLPEFITRAAEEWFRQPIVASLQREGLSTEWYYTTSPEPDDKRVSMGGTRPDTGRNVHGLKNAVSLLIETRGVGIGRLHLARRVQTQVVALTSVLRSAAARADDLVKLRSFVDQDVAAAACKGEAVVDAAPTPSEYVLRMLDPDTGADRPVTVAWDSALQLQVLKTRPRPCGYWLAADQQDAALRLRALGLVVQRIEAVGVMRGEVYREVSRSSAPRQDGRGQIADGGEVVLVQVQTVPMLLDVTPGGWYVGLDQPLANLAIAALEPDTQSSYVASGLIGNVGAVARVLLRPELRTSALP